MDGDKLVYTDANGNLKDNQGFFTQNVKFYEDGYANKYNEYWADINSEAG